MKHLLKDVSPNRRGTVCAAVYTRLGLPSVFLGEKFGKRLLPLSESTFHPPADEQCVSDRADDTKPDFIVDQVADQSSGDAFSGLRSKFMTVVPLLEWTLVLHIGKVLIPFKFRDARDPARADRKQRKDAKGGDDGRPHAGCLAEAAIPTGGGRHALERNQLGRARSRHDSRQIFRVRKKEKYGFQPKRHPLLKF